MGRSRSWRADPRYRARWAGGSEFGTGGDTLEGAALVGADTLGTAISVDGCGLSVVVVRAPVASLWIRVKPSNCASAVMATSQPQPP